ncbi:signal recognition particle-docking protein FtsY [Deltaproteobacteria bacterium TL4]
MITAFVWFSVGIVGATGLVAGLVKVFVVIYYVPPTALIKSHKTLTAKDAEKQIVQFEKERLKLQEAETKEQARIEKAKNEIRLAKAREQEEKLKTELEEKQKELTQKQSLTKAILVEEESKAPPTNFLERLKQGISKTRNNLMQGLGEAVLGKKEIDDEVLDHLEEVLLSADIGPETTYRILEAITQKVERKELKDPQVLQKMVKNEIVKIMSKTYAVTSLEEKKPLVLLFVGVNGVGKTTTIGKIAAQYQQQGKKVLMGAGDTFRAAAIEQLTEWSKRAGCDIIAKTAGSDPSSVMYESVQKAINENYDVVICDTAGRLHTKQNLMEELKKMIRVIQKLIPEAPHEVLLVLDATTGQNAIFQTRDFRQAANLTGLVITKLDGTAKGGVVIGIVNEFDIPVRYIGVGESVEDLRPFDAIAFTNSLFE